MLLATRHSRTMYPGCLLAIVILLQVLENKGSLTWPYGKYTLLKPSTGCPRGWDDKGYLYQNTIDEYPRNSRSDTLHIDGEVASSHVKRYFCSKTKRKGKKPSGVWHSGQYCVYVDEEQTLYTMTKGSIFMYDRENKKDENILRKTIKFFKKMLFGSYEGTSLYFACQTNGNKKIPISLPITKPFYLLPYGSRDCQQVKWMVATSEWIKYQTDNYNGRNYKYGTVPYHELGDFSNRGIKMFYCYYEKCKYTLTDKKGVFQSPGFPGKYPDGQLCSWRIMVPDNHTLHVHFTNFSLDGNDTLKYIKRLNGMFRWRYTIRVSMVPFTLSADRDVRFVFRSDESNNSSGFRAEYHVFIPQATPTTTTTTTKKPSTVPVTTTLTVSKTPSSKSKLSTTKLRSSTTTMNTKLSTPGQTFENKSSAEAIRDSPFGSKNKAIVVMVIPAVCLLIGVVLLIMIIYQYRIKNRSSRARNSKRDAGTTRDCSVMNPTYERGAIPLNPPNETGTANIALNSGDDSRMYGTLTRDSQEYEDVEYEEFNKETRNENPINSGAGKKSGSVKNSGPNPLYQVTKEPTPDPTKGLSEDQSNLEESRESEDVQDSGPNPLYYFLEGPGPNYGLVEDQGNSESRESDFVQDSGPCPLYHVLEGPGPNVNLAEDRPYEDVD